MEHIESTEDIVALIEQHSTTDDQIGTRTFDSDFQMLQNAITTAEQDEEVTW